MAAAGFSATMSVVRAGCLAVGLSVSVAACSDGNGDPESAESGTPESSGNCVAVQESDLDLQGMLPDGGTPQALLDGVAGPRTYPLRWERSGIEEREVTTAFDGTTTELAVTLAFDGGEIVLRDMEPNPNTEVSASCPDRVVMDVVVGLQTTDGALDVAWSGELQQLFGPAGENYGRRVDAEASLEMVPATLGLSVATMPGETVRVSATNRFDFGPEGGTIGGVVEQNDGVIVGGFSFQLAVFGEAGEGSGSDGGSSGATGTGG